MEREDLEHEADVLDRAARVSDEHTQDSIDHYRRLAAPEQEQLPDGSWSVTECVDCDEPIEAERVRMGRVRCFACQDLKERRGRYNRG